MTDHLQLMEEAKAAIDKVFGDKSVDQKATLESLDELISIIEIHMEAIEADLEEDPSGV